MHTLALLTLLAATASAATHLYPAPQSPAPDFEVQINGKPAFVHDTPAGPFVHFSLSGPVEVTVKIRANVQYTTAQELETWGKRYKPQPIALPLSTVNIRPQSARITPTVRGDTLRFRVPRPVNLSIEFAGNLTRPLFLFAAPPEQDAPKPDAPGVRYFAPGKVYDVGRLKLASGESIYIAGGAVVRGTILAEARKTCAYTAEACSMAATKPRPQAP